jgi:hypothetical protein
VPYKITQVLMDRRPRLISVFLHHRTRRPFSHGLRTPVIRHPYLALQRSLLAKRVWECYADQILSTCTHAWERKDNADRLEKNQMTTTSSMGSRRRMRVQRTAFGSGLGCCRPVLSPLAHAKGCMLPSGVPALAGCGMASAPPGQKSIHANTRN